jgi:WD40 repeat protein
MLFSNKVTSLVFSNASQQLISAGEDSMIIAWNMHTKRCEVIIISF